MTLGTSGWVPVALDMALDKQQTNGEQDCPYPRGVHAYRNMACSHVLAYMQAKM